MTERKFTPAIIRGIGKDADEKRSVDFILSTSQKDRHGTVLNQNNWKLENYRKNPIVGYAHNLSGGIFTPSNPDYVIGKATNIHVEGAGEKSVLISTVEFEPAANNPLAEKIFRKVLFGSLSRSSVGFIEVGKGHYGSGDEAFGRENETYYFNGQELLEWSIVNIPSNPGAGKRQFRNVGGLPIGSQCYAIQQLSDRYKPSEIENLSIEDLDLLLEAKDLNIKERDPEKIRRMLKDPIFINDRIEFERAAFRKAKEAETIINRNTQNNFKSTNNQSMKQPFSLMRVISQSLNKNNFDETSLSVIDAGIRAMEEAGLKNLTLGNAICLPIKQRAVIAAVAGNVPQSPLYALPPAAEKTVFAAAGASIYTGIIGNVTVPSMSSIAASWKGQNEDSGSETGVIGSINFTPLRLSAWFDVSKLLMLQSGPDVEQYLANCLTGAVAAQLEATILSCLARTSYRPSGMGLKTSSSLTKVPDFNDILEMEAEVAALKALQGNLAYITSGKGKRILKTVKKDTNGFESLMERGIMNDHPVFISNFASDNAGISTDGSLLVFGNWADLGIIQFGAYMLTVDPFSQAKDNKLRIFVDAYFDVKGMRFAADDTDEYVGFSALPIKLS